MTDWYMPIEIVEQAVMHPYIQEDLEVLGINGKTYYVTQSDSNMKNIMYITRVIFETQEDLNLYKLIGMYKERVQDNCAIEFTVKDNEKR